MTNIESIAIGKNDLLARTATEVERHRYPRGVIASLAVEAREAARLAASATIDPDRPEALGTPRGTGVVTVPRSHRLPDAVANLTHILTLEEPSAPDLLATTRVLAQTSRATAHALAAAATAPHAGIPTELTATADALAAHADHLASAVTTTQTRLGSITPGSPLLIAQAREIGAIAVPGLRALATRPAAAEAASPHLLRYAEIIPTVTDAIRTAVTDLDRRGLILLRDPSLDAVQGWRRTGPDDLRDLTTNLDAAAAAARTAPPPIRTAPTATIPAATVAAGGAIINLQAALLRRQNAVRPRRPANPRLDYPTITHQR